MIDLIATKEKIRSTGRTTTGWARTHGFDTMKAHARFRGNTKFGPDWIEALRADGLLVEAEEEQKDAA